MRHSFLPLSVVLTLATSAAYAQRDLKDIPDPDFRVERDTFVLPEGFEATLYASDPQIAKPIQMNFDPDGRLWIASSSVYPQVAPGQEANDRILIVEDTDRDGTADKTTVFADGLLIPSGVMPGDGGAYVAASTDLFFFKDTNGDGRADEKRFVLTGFGTEDTHHTLHTLRWGPEQLLYFKQSIYIHSHLETPWGVKRLNAGGTWQFRPSNMKLSVFDRGLVNSWGIAWNDEGSTFETDGAGGEGINYIVPGASYVTAYGADRILSGLNPGSPKHCGLEIVGGPSFPESWQGSLITNDFRGHRVCRFVIKEIGSGYVSQEQQEVIKSTHPAFRPIDVKQGPDGALYIADWYNPIIQHGEVDFRDPRRDHVHGRIWRVTWKGTPKPPATGRLSELSVPQLLERLTSDDRFTRQAAKRILCERGAEQVHPALKAWSRSLDNSAPHFHRHRLEALWLYQGLDVAEWELLDSLVRCDSPGERAAAVRVIGHWIDRNPPDFDAPSPLSGLSPAVVHGKANPVGLLELAVADPHPRVRLEAVRVLGEIPHPRAIEIAARVLDQPMDEYLDYALWLTARELQPVWQPALTAGEIDFDGQARHVAFVCRAAGSQAAVPTLQALLSAGKVDAEEMTGVLEVIGDFGTSADLQSLLDFGHQQMDNSAPVLNALRASQKRRQVTPDNPAENLTALTQSMQPEVRGPALELAGRYRILSLFGSVVAGARDDDQNVASSAIAGLEAYADGPAIKELEALTGDPRVWPEAIASLLSLKPSEAAAAFVARLKGPAPVNDAEARSLNRLTQSFLQRKDGPALFMAALKNQQIDPDQAKSVVRIVAASGQPQEALSAALRTAGRLDAQPKMLTPEEAAKLLAEVRDHGDAVHGEVVFRREDLTCLKCHAIGDAGGVVGPNLVSLGASAQPDYILESLLDPNAKIKENYHTLVVATDEGEVLTGIKVRETGRDLILRDAEDREVSIPLAKIEVQKPGASIMPSGLIDKLTRNELIDLVTFLSSLGRVPEFTVGQSPIARRWEVLEASPETAGHFYRLGLQEATRDNASFQWKTTYSLVDGELPVQNLPDMKMLGQSRGDRGLTFLRCELEAATEGTATLKLEAPDDTRAWLDGQPLEIKAEIPVTLTAGTHKITLAINQLSPAQPLKLSVSDNGTAAARFIGGK